MSFNNIFYTIDNQTDEIAYAEDMMSQNNIQNYTINPRSIIRLSKTISNIVTIKIPKKYTLVCIGNNNALAPKVTNLYNEYQLSKLGTYTIK